ESALSTTITPGDYKLYMMDKTSYNYTFSEIFTISNNNQFSYATNNSTTPNNPPSSNPPSASNLEGVLFDAPLNVTAGSNIAITWSYSGTQSRLAVLGIMNSQNSNIQIIDSNVDLTKKSQPWVFVVGTGSYKFYLMDKISYGYAYSNTFIVSPKSE
ncbi:12021_t:CDS:2, partial [Racocetra persica]